MGKHGQTRDRLLDAGLELFADRGFDAVPIRELESAAGLAQGTGSFHRHFSSKHELMQQLIKREVAQVVEWRDLNERTVAGSLGDTRAEILLTFRMSLMFLEKLQKLVMLLAREYGNFPDEFEQIRQLLVVDSRTFIAQEYQQRMDNGEIPRRDPLALASVAQNSIVGFHLSRMFFGESPDQVDAEDFANTLADMICASGDAA